MQKVNTFQLYSLGYEIAALKKLGSSSVRFGDIMFPLMSARTEIESLLNSTAIIVRTSKSAAVQLISAISAAVPLSYVDAFKLDHDRVIESWEIISISEAAKRFETVLAEELNTLDTYAVAQKGAYSTHELITNAQVIFPPNVRGRLPPQTVSDICEAGRCLAFENPTASAFHIMRAIESMILAYHKKITGNDAPSRMRNWGIYINKLRADDKHDPKIVNFLEHIKDSYRNPISHPEATLTIEEVLVLLGASTSLITQIALAL